MKVKVKFKSLRQAAPILEASRSYMMGGIEASFLGRKRGTHISIKAQNGFLTLGTERAENPPKDNVSIPSWIYHTCKADVTEDGEVLASADELLRFIAGSKSEDVEISSDAIKLTLITGNQQICLPTTKLLKDHHTLMMDNLLAGITLETGMSCKVNQLVLGEGIRRHAAAPPPTDRGVNTFCFFRDGKLHIGDFPIVGIAPNVEDYVCDASLLAENPGEFLFIIPAYSIRGILTSLLVHNADVTLTRYDANLVDQSSIFFENPGEPAFFFHWKIF